MKKIFMFVLLTITGILRGINYLVAQVSIPLSMIPYLIGVVVVWILQGITKIFITLDGDFVNIYAEDYQDMIKEIKRKKYDELYDEMKKREKQD